MLESDDVGPPIPPGLGVCKQLSNTIESTKTGWGKEGSRVKAEGAVLFAESRQSGDIAARRLQLLVYPPFARR